MSNNPNDPKNSGKFRQTIMGTSPIGGPPPLPPRGPVSEQETNLQPSEDDEEGNETAAAGGGEENWVISFNQDGSHNESKVAGQSGISDSRLGQRVIDGGKQKFGSATSPGATEPGFPQGEDVYTAGTMVYKYEIIKLLGRGGMGAVYAAHDTKLGRKVAIKFLNRKISGKSKFRQRFMIEAQATAKLNHENVVTIYDVGEFQGSSYLVLEYLEGSPLTKIMKGRKLPASQALHYAIPVAKALGAAHAKGIIHRDLKPDNIYVMKDGGVKVLDFGLAKLIDTADDQQVDKAQLAKEIAADGGQGLTKAGAIMGTYAYMSPEQWGVAKVDLQSDIFALGVILFEMLTMEHPTGTRAAQALADAAGSLDIPYRTVRDVDPTIPQEISDVIAKCLAKRKQYRYPDVQELIRDFEQADPNAGAGRRLTETDAPYPGLSSFQERDADKFFGRDLETARFIAKMSQNALLAVIGPSGAGKSSFIRAGVIPAIKRQGRKPWDMIVIRPGRDPFAALANALLRGGTSSTVNLQSAKEEQQLAHKLQKEPGQLGTLLRARARSSGHPVMLFVDQFEETFTLVNVDEAALFTTALAGAGEDPEIPVRVVLSMRSDFLDRVAEFPELMEKVTRDVTILQAPNSAGLHEAIVRPAQLIGYAFEDPHMVEEMVNSLRDEPAALPLLQFTASKLWENRDKSRKLLTRRVYDEMGGVGGALARHADAVLSGMTTQDQTAVKRLFQRLVTSDGTRAVITVSEIRAIMGQEVAARILKTLALARLLTVSNIGEHGEDAQVEIVHESLIARWQTLKRWLEEDNENAAMLQQLREAAKQWDLRSRPNGLLWSGDALDEARLWLKRYQGGLTDLERLFLDHAFRLSERSARRKKYLIATAIILMAMVTLGAIGALFMIRGAEQNAKAQAQVARKEADRAASAEQEVKKKMVLLADETERAKSAEGLASSRLKEVEKARDQERAAQAKVQESNKALVVALDNAKAAQKRAEEATRRAEEARRQVARSAELEKTARVAADEARKNLAVLLDKEKETVRKLQALRSKIIQSLPER